MKFWHNLHSSLQFVFSKCGMECLDVCIFNILNYMLIIYSWLTLEYDVTEIRHVETLNLGELLYRVENGTKILIRKLENLIKKCVNMKLGALFNQVYINKKKVYIATKNIYIYGVRHVIVDIQKIKCIIILMIQLDFLKKIGFFQQFW